ncbi:MAG TPA: hypothetical protein VLE73_05345 [Candidatus Saccharimonadales bacterium]|nr:hypothetical protein [Candidatus Saccharimonadales bacterium]
MAEKPKTIEAFPGDYTWGAPGAVDPNASVQVTDARLAQQVHALASGATKNASGNVQTTAATVDAIQARARDRQADLSPRTVEQIRGDAPAAGAVALRGASGYRYDGSGDLRPPTAAEIQSRT